MHIYLFYKIWERTKSTLMLILQAISHVAKDGNNFE